jgi:hypothetical protein
MSEVSKRSDESQSRAELIEEAISGMWSLIIQVCGFRGPVSGLEYYDKPVPLP